MQPSVLFLISLTFIAGALSLTTRDDATTGDPALSPANVTGFNSSALGSPLPPKGFSISYNIGGPKLNQTSLLMNTVAALRLLALGDWDGKVTDGTKYASDSYPEVSILVNTPKRLRSIPVSVIVWAITAGVYKVIEEKKFEFAQFEMRKYDQLVGWVHVSPNNRPFGSLAPAGYPVNSTFDNVARRDSRPISSTNTSSQMQASDVTNIITTDILTTEDPEEARLTTTFTPYGTPMKIYDIFIPIMGGLAELARFPNQHRTQFFIEERTGYSGTICIGSTPLFMAGPPYLEYQWLTRAIARIPGYMFESRRFGEVKIVLEVDRVMIAMGKMGTVEGLCGDG